MKKIFFSALLVTGAMALYAPTESEKEAIGVFLKNMPQEIVVELDGAEDAIFIPKEFLTYNPDTREINLPRGYNLLLEEQRSEDELKTLGKNMADDLLKKIHGLKVFDPENQDIAGNIERWLETKQDEQYRQYTRELINALNALSEEKELDPIQSALTEGALPQISQYEDDAFQTLLSFAKDELSKTLPE